MNKIFEFISLVVGFSAVAIITYRLVLYPAIVFYEPILWVRMLEVIMGLVSLPILLVLMIKKFILLEGS